MYAGPVDADSYPIEPGAYLNRITIDGTPEGYMQFAVLQIMGQRFYLYWHAAYMDSRIVCDQEALEAVVLSISDAGYRSFSPDELEVIRGIEVEPTIEFGEDKVTVQYLSFSRFKGFSRNTVTISRDAPPTEFDFESELLLPYDCGIIY